MKESKKKDNGMCCLGIESTAHTFGCSIIQFDSIKTNGEILSEIRSIYKAPNGAGIHPREASRHHLDKAPDLLRNVLEKANIKDRKSTRLNSSHIVISYTVFCLR